MFKYFTNLFSSTTTKKTRGTPLLDQLFKAVKNGDIPAIETLLPQFTESELCSPSLPQGNITVLHMAMRAPEEKVDPIVKLLLSKAPNLVNVPGGYFGKTPIQIAAEQGFLNAIQTLIQAGAYLMLIDRQSRTILHAVVSYSKNTAHMLQLCLRELTKQLPDPEVLKQFINQRKRPTNPTIAGFLNFPPIR